MESERDGKFDKIFGRGLCSQWVNFKGVSPALVFPKSE